MTLTHDEIAGMTCKDVNEEIGIRLGTINIDWTPPQVPDYCHDWHEAGRLLEDMVESGVLLRNTLRDRLWECITFNNDMKLISVMSPTSPEAIARCWLEWWEVTHG